MFSELDNVDVLFSLGGLPRIALLTTGFPGLFISICKKNNVNVVVVVVLCCIYTYYILT